MTARLAAIGLCARYAGRRTLCDVSMHVGRGERLALLGANGAGKTTLLYHLDGLLVPEAGEVRLHGVPIARTGKATAVWRRAVGLLFQNPDDQLFGPTVLDDVAIGPRNGGATSAEARRLAFAMLERLGIGTLAREPVHALSLGQRRAVGLAGVLVMDPAVLLLDEPTQGLDAVTEEALLGAVEEARVGGVSIVMATHDVDLVCRWADRVVALSHGRVVCDGPPDTVLADSMISQASLRRPWALEVGRTLQRLGVLPSEVSLPTSGPALAEALASLERRCPAQVAVGGRV